MHVWWPRWTPAPCTAVGWRGWGSPRTARAQRVSGALSPATQGQAPWSEGSGVCLEPRVRFRGWDGTQVSLLPTGSTRGEAGRAEAVVMCLHQTSRARGSR